MTEVNDVSVESAERVQLNTAQDRKLTDSIALLIAGSTTAIVVLLIAKLLAFYPFGT